MSVAATLESQRETHAACHGWMRSAYFDLNFIVVVALVALLTGLVAILEPSLFAVVLFLDVWLLGFHHVVSTFTRLVFDRQSFKQHRFLVIQLPVIVLLSTLGAVWALGYWVLPTVYLYWQWFHYTRQSYGIERIYRHKADKQAVIQDYVTTRTLYLVPLFGILYRSYQQQPIFLGMELAYLPVPPLVVGLVGGLAAFALLCWICELLTAFFHGRLATAHTLYVVSHHLIFLTGYILMEDITTGWLVLNIWHNAQYILFVWWYNNNRFKKGVDSQSWLLSTLSQTSHAPLYFGVCLLICTVGYFAIQDGAGQVEAATAVPVTLVAFMVINFHHYVVDGIIWKGRKPAAGAAASARANGS